jgi:adenylate cyclase
MVMKPPAPGAGGFSAHNAQSHARLGVMTEVSEPADAALVAAIAGEPLKYSAPEASQRSGVPVETIERLWRAFGLRWLDTSTSCFSDSDIGVLGSFALGSEIFGEEATLHFARAIGVATARMSQAAVSLFLMNAAEELRDRSDAEQVAAYELAGTSFNTLPLTLERLFRLHALRAVERWRQERRIGERYDVQTLAVGFVDLVGFTEQTRDLPPSRLVDLITRFEADACESVTASGGEVVKLIGDAVMFVANTAVAGSLVALALSDIYEFSEVTPRGGLAFGPVLARGGDFYGPTVNVASRLATLAVPGEVLVTSEMRSAAAVEQLRFDPAGRRVLKGFVDPIEAFSLNRR